MGLFSGITKAVKGVVGAITGSGIGSALSTFSPYFAAGMNYLGQSSANNTNMDIASANNATSIELANSAYQRRVKDLAAAGLNPILAYQQGGAQGELMDRNRFITKHYKLQTKKPRRA